MIAVYLAILLAALFPANIRAARQRLTILGRPAPGVVVRGAMRVNFVSALVAVAVSPSLGLAGTLNCWEHTTALNGDSDRDLRIRRLEESTNQLLPGQPLDQLAMLRIQP
jgi:hypothetical protein